MDAKAGSSSPSSVDAYRKRRDSYSAAIINETSISDEGSLNSRRSETPVKSQQLVLQKRTRLPDNSSLESESWSTASSLMKRELTRTPSTDTSRSWSESIEIPEIFLSHPELVGRLARCRCFLAAKLSISSECQCQCRCQCRCSQCQYYRRKISSCSSRDQAFLGGFRRKDSSYSVSTCQSILPPSSGRNSFASLYHEGKEEGREPVHVDGVIERRHSDQTQSPRGGKIGRADSRRFSEQTLVRVGSECCGRRNSGCVAEAGASRPIIARTCPRYHPEKVTGTRSTESWPPLHNESRETELARETQTDGRLGGARQKKEKRDENGSGERRRSSVSITPKMMRRRFSEQLILEGGLGSVQDYEDLLEGPADGAEEESLTMANARKRITLKRHYYPEGGWGHVIVLVAILVQVICHGLQLGSGVSLSSTAEQFESDVAHAGRNRLFASDVLPHRGILVVY
ncbi:unnamed protein product [Xylocopa violacea]|uniref:Uncharacterized protein n=1 Tax=Xylocopa violacea TaxID=135666 RepID=A0ABP1NXZ4_XYLVO